MINVKWINDRRDMIELAAELGVRDDWHEPDEQGVTVEIRGDNFDNAGNSNEITVCIYQDHIIMAEVNLATLLSIAAGH